METFLPEIQSTQERRGEEKTKKELEQFSGKSHFPIRPGASFDSSSLFDQSGCPVCIQTPRAAEREPPSELIRLPFSSLGLYVREGSQ